MKRLVVALSLALLAVPLAFVAAPASPAAAALPPFSAIGDSTLLGMTSSAKAVLELVVLDALRGQELPAPDHQELRAGPSSIPTRWRPCGACRASSVTPW